MKRITIAMLFVAALPFGVLAQDEKTEQPEQRERKERPEKKETSELIIRQDGDKEIKLKVEIDGDKVTVNGKPLSEFKDDNVSINKRKMTITDGDHIMSLDFNNGNDWGKWGEAFGKNFEQSWNLNEEGKGAFLGVTTETEAGGAKVVEVSKGSAAEKAGLKKGDIITKVGDEKIDGPDALSDVIAFKKPNDEVKITYKREGKQNTVKATLGKRKKMNHAFSQPQVRSFSFPKMPASPYTNMEGLQDIQGDLAQIQDDAIFHTFPDRKKIGLKIQDTEDGNGVKIINVEDSSAAATAGIKKDDIITEINGKKIENTDDAREELVPDEEKKSYKIKINRGGSEMNFDVKIPRKLKTANL
jgi:serine protease Do